MCRSHITESAPSFGCCMPQRGGYRTQSLSWFCCQWQLEYTRKQTTHGVVCYRPLRATNDGLCTRTVTMMRIVVHFWYAENFMHSMLVSGGGWGVWISIQSVMRVKKALQSRFWTLTPSNISAHPCMHLPAFYVLIKLLTTWQFFLCRANAWNQTTDNCKTVWPSSIYFGW